MHCRLCHCTLKYLSNEQSRGVCLCFREAYFSGTQCVQYNYGKKYMPVFPSTSTVYESPSVTFYMYANTYRGNAKLIIFF